MMMASACASPRGSASQPSPAGVASENARSAELRTRAGASDSESLCVAKPPRQPGGADGHSAAPTARKRTQHAAERVRALEAALEAANAANIAVERLYGRAVIKRRDAERERDTFRAKLDTVIAAAPSDTLLAFAQSGRGEVEGDEHRSCHSFVSSCVFGDDRNTQMDSLVDIVDMLEAKLSAAAVAAPSASSSSPRAAAALVRARATLAARRPAAAADAVVAERDALRRQLDAALAAAENSDDAVAASLRAVLADASADVAALRTRVCALEQIRERNEAAERALTAELDETKRLLREQNGSRRTARAVPAFSASQSAPPPLALSRDSPRSARYTSAAPSPSSLFHAASSSHAYSPSGAGARIARDPRFAPSEDVVRRVQSWRERASSEATPGVRPTARDENRARSSITGGPTPDVRRTRAARTVVPQRSDTLDLRRLITLGGGEDTTTAARPARAPRVRSARSMRDSRSVRGAHVGGRPGARAFRGQDRSTPSRIRSDVARRPVSMDADSERSANASDACSAASHGIVDRHASYAAMVASMDGQAPIRDFFGPLSSRSVGLRELVSDSAGML